jgi:L-fucose isomerase
MAIKKLTGANIKSKVPPITIGIVGPFDPRLDEETPDNRERAANIVEHVAKVVSNKVGHFMLAKVNIVWTDLLIRYESDADKVGIMFQKAGVNALVVAPDTWAFPDRTILALLNHLPDGIPVILVCGNSGPKPGVVFAHAMNGSLAEKEINSTLIVGSWPDTGLKPTMSEETEELLTDALYAAVTKAGWKGRRVLLLGPTPSMDMGTGEAPIEAMRKTFGLGVARLDMKLVADLLVKKAYNGKELKRLRNWIGQMLGKRLKISGQADEQKFQQELALYLIINQLVDEYNAIGWTFKNQLEWGSDTRGIPLPVPDFAESAANSTEDHNGPKRVMPAGTETDVKGLITMLMMSWLTNGNPPLFMDFRKVYQRPELIELCKALNISMEGPTQPWHKGFFDGNNSGSGSFDWAGKPGMAFKNAMRGVSMPQADKFYFPGGGKSVTFITPGDIDCIAGRLGFFWETGKFSLLWDQARTVELPDDLAKKVIHISTWSWPHTFLVLMHAIMAQAKQYSPANHWHAIWGLKATRLQHFMDMTSIRNMHASVWPKIDKDHRPVPVIKLLNGTISEAS